MLENQRTQGHWIIDNTSLEIKVKPQEAPWQHKFSDWILPVQQFTNTEEGGKTRAKHSGTACDSIAYPTDVYS